MINFKQNIKSIILILLILSISSCENTTSDSDNPPGTETTDPPDNTTTTDPEDSKPPQTPSNGDVTAGGTTTPIDPDNHFSNTDCNRVYWTFKCALNYKKTQSHTEECQKNMTSFYPENENVMVQVEAQSQNSEEVIRETWLTFFNANCKEDLAVKSYLRNLD